MLNIGNKKYRNMQEQVGWNSERIDKILEFLDGVNLSDNVVVINDMSQILTPEELEIVNKTVSFLVYDGSLYIKKSQDASEAKFDIIFTISGSSVVSFNSKEITVTLSNGALGLATASYSVYSVSQIDSLLSAKASITYVDGQLALKASLSGANFTGPITSPSIIENMSGYGFINGAAIENFTQTNVFVSAVKNGNKLTCVFCATLKRTGAVSETSKELGYITMPSAVANQLQTVSVGGNQFLDNKKIQLFSSHFSSIDAYVYVGKATNSMYFRLLTPSTLVQDTEYFMRYEVTFLLGSNLAQ